jgi:hypothetical protein
MLLPVVNAPAVVGVERLVTLGTVELVVFGWVRSVGLLASPVSGVSSPGVC